MLKNCDCDDDSFVFTHKRQADKFFIDLTDEKPQVKKAKDDSSTNDEIQIVKVIPGDSQLDVERSQSADMKIVETVDINKSDVIKVQEEVVFMPPVIVKVEKCDSSKPVQILDISKCAVNMSAGAPEQKSSAVSRNVIDLTTSEDQVDAVVAEVSVSTSIPKPSSDVSGNAPVTSTDKVVDVEKEKKEVCSSPESSAVDNSQDSTEHEQPYLYQNQLEDPEVQKMYDADWFGKHKLRYIWKKKPVRKY